MVFKGILQFNICFIPGASLLSIVLCAEGNHSSRSGHSHHSLLCKRLPWDCIDHKDWRPPPFKGALDFLHVVHRLLLQTCASECIRHVLARVEGCMFGKELQHHITLNPAPALLLNRPDNMICCLAAIAEVRLTRAPRQWIWSSWSCCRGNEGQMMKTRRACALKDASTLHTCLDDWQSCTPKSESLHVNLRRLHRHDWSTNAAPTFPTQAPTPKTKRRWIVTMCGKRLAEERKRTSWSKFSRNGTFARKCNTLQSQYLRNQQQT